MQFKIVPQSELIKNEVTPAEGETYLRLYYEYGEYNQMKVNNLNLALKSYYAGYKIRLEPVVIPGKSFKIWYTIVPTIALQLFPLEEFDQDNLITENSTEERKDKAKLNKIEEIKAKLKRAVQNKYAIEPQEYQGDLEGVVWQPMPHQDKITRWCLARKKVIIGLGPRMGKSLIAILTAIYSGNFDNTLIISPSHLVSQWKVDSQREDLNADILHYNGGKTRPDGIQHFCKKIVSGKSVKYEVAKPLKKKYQCIIIDESRKVKGHTTAFYQCTQAIIDYCQPEYVLLLDGTPNPNNQGEFWTQLKLIDHPAGDISKAEFELVFNNWLMTQPTEAGKEYRTSTNALLKELLAPVAQIHTKKTLGVNLSEYKIEQQELSVPDSLQKELDEIKEKDMQIIINQGSIDSKTISTSLVKMIVACARYKVQYTLEYLKTHPDKIVIGSSYNNGVLDELASKLDLPVLKGGVSMTMRDKIVKDFQDKDLNVLLAQLAVADCGLNLSSAKTLYFHNLPWSLGAFIQFLSRPLNVMKTEITNIVIPYFKGTIEEGMISTLVRKAENFESLLDKLDDSEEDGGLSKELNIVKEFAKDYWAELMGEVQNRK